MNTNLPQSRSVKARYVLYARETLRIIWDWGDWHVCIGVMLRSHHQARDLLEAGADLVIGSFAEITVEDVAKLLSGKTSGKRIVPLVDKLF